MIETKSILVFGVAFFLSQPCLAAGLPHFEESEHLQKCLAKADEFPDIGATEAAVWIKNGGGDEAHLCRAMAQANRGMHEDAAREFWGLASIYDKKDLRHGLLMHNLSGQEFVKAKDIPNAEAQYVEMLKKAPNDSDALTGRAQIKIGRQNYWEALDDLNLALKSNPQNIEALRTRGNVWTHLGDDHNAQADFARVELLSTAKDK